MIINNALLQTLRVGFRTEFQKGLGLVDPMGVRVAMTVHSSTGENRYGWLKKLPGMRKWVGPRQLNGIAEHGYSIVNDDFESTVEVSRNDIDDENLGQYSTMFSELGESAGALKEQLIWGALKDGFASQCFDGQNFFDTDHPIIGADGNETTYSNSGGGSGTPWYLLCTKRTVKPVIYQERKPVTFTHLDRETDPNVFHNKTYIYGADWRGAVGYGFPQMAYGSKQTLDADTYAAARAAIQNMTADHGRPLGLVPDLLVVPSELESKAREILLAERTSSGETNVWQGTAEPLMVPWLS